MNRNTNIEELQFPVILKPVYIKKNKYKGLTNYSAVTGTINKKENVFSVVSRNYALILNDEAIVLGKKIFKEGLKIIDTKNSRKMRKFLLRKLVRTQLNFSQLPHTPRT